MFKVDLHVGCRPSLRTYEVVSLLCMVAIGFAIPLTLFRERSYMKLFVEVMGIPAAPCKAGGCSHWPMRDAGVQNV